MLAFDRCNVNKNKKEILTEGIINNQTRPSAKDKIPSKYYAVVLN